MLVIIFDFFAYTIFNEESGQRDEQGKESLLPDASGGSGTIPGGSGTAPSGSGTIPGGSGTIPSVCDTNKPLKASSELNN